METIVDTHAHLDFPQFDGDREDVIGRAREAGVRWLINPGADLESSRRAVQLSECYPEVYAAVGVHPHDAKTLTPTALEELRELARHPKVVAIGEIGLDYYRDLSPREVQRKAFQLQLCLAAELDLPIIVHDRDAHEDVLRILEAWGAGRPRAGVFHAFPGDAAMARRVARMGYHVAVGGPVTFANARRLLEIPAAVPGDRLLLETDCPYLTPHPYRGRRNEPAYLRLVLARVSQLLGEPVDVVAAQTTRNAQRLFGLR